MWRRLKLNLWGGRTVVDVDADPEPAEAQPSPEDAALARDLAVVDAHLAAGDIADALGALRGLLLAGKLGRQVLARSSAAMEAFGDAALAAAFQAAAAGRGADSLVELSVAFLGMDDAPVALALANAAQRRARGEDPIVTGVQAEAAARTGQHAEVLKLLSRYEGRWPDPVLLQRYAASAIVAGDRTRYERVESALSALPDTQGLRRAAERAHAFEAAPDASDLLRRAMFVAYGATLVDGEGVTPGGAVSEADLGRLLEATRDVLRAGGVQVDRVAYATTRGEVFAHWLARLLDSSPIPLSARLADQSVVVVVADDDDLIDACRTPGFAGVTAPLVQVVQDPRIAGGPVADIVAMLGEDVALPLGKLTAEKAADRSPPRMLFNELWEVAQRGRAGASETWPTAADWVAGRKAWLTLGSTATMEGRPAFAADLTYG